MVVDMNDRNLLDDRKILIVDDEPDVLETMAELLSNCRVKTANSFVEARELLENERFDIAILDIMGVNGYELIRISLNNDVIPVMLTANAVSPDHIVHSYRLGAASFLPKDVMPDLPVFLEDILDAKARGKSTWWRWYERLAGLWEGKFGKEWQDREKEFWEKFPTL
jgi:DNA-binding NtrC family response regulator